MHLFDGNTVFVVGGSNASCSIWLALGLSALHHVLRKGLQAISDIYFRLLVRIVF